MIESLSAALSRRETEGWTMERELLASVVDAVNAQTAVLIAVFGGGKGKKLDPPRVKRPWDGKEKRDTPKMTMGAFAAKLGAGS